MFSTVAGFTLITLCFLLPLLTFFTSFAAVNFFLRPLKNLAIDDLTKMTNILLNHVYVRKDFKCMNSLDLLLPVTLLGDESTTVVVGALVADCL